MCLTGRARHPRARTPSSSAGPPPQGQPHRLLPPRRPRHMPTHARPFSRARRVQLAHPLPRRPAHQLLQPEIPPADLALALRRALYAEGGVLVGHDVVFVFGVEGLQVRRDVYFFGREGRGGAVGKVFEVVGVVGMVEVEVRECGVARLWVC